METIGYQNLIQEIGLQYPYQHQVNIKQLLLTLILYGHQVIMVMSGNQI